MVLSIFRNFLKQFLNSFQGHLELQRFWDFSRNFELFSQTKPSFLTILKHQKLCFETLFAVGRFWIFLKLANEFYKSFEHFLKHFKRFFLKFRYFLSQFHAWPYNFTQQFPQRHPKFNRRGRSTLFCLVFFHLTPIAINNNPSISTWRFPAARNILSVSIFTSQSDVTRLKRSRWTQKVYQKAFSKSIKYFCWIYWSCERVAKSSDDQKQKVQIRMNHWNCLFRHLTSLQSIFFPSRQCLTHSRYLGADKMSHASLDASNLSLPTHQLLTFD